MNFVCIVFELGDKMLTLSSMENLIVQCNHLPTFRSPGPFIQTLVPPSQGGSIYRRRCLKMWMDGQRTDDDDDNGRRIL